MKWMFPIAGLIVSATLACGDDGDKGSETSNAADGVLETEVVPDAGPDTAPDALPDSGPDTEPGDTDPGDTDPGDTGPDAPDTTDGDVTPSAMSHMLCHAPDGAAETIVVAEGDVEGHLDHGDQRGPCSPLTATLVPDSHTIIDCGGREMTAADPTLDTFLFLHDVVAVHLVDCVVRFDFGVFIVGGGEHVITDNALHTASEVVTILDSAGNRIANNLARYAGAGIIMNRDADRNVIEGNDLAPSGGELGHVWPGLPEQLEESHPALVITDYPGPEVSFAFINGELVQVPNRDTTSDDNVLRDNDVAGGDPAGVALLVRAKGTLVQGNRIHGGGFGIASIGYGDGFPISLPGTCGLAPDRFCGSDEDCDLPGYDPMPLGTCDGTSSSYTETRVAASRIEDNVIDGEFEVGILQMSTRDAVVSGNTISGGNIGISLWDYSVQAITVTGNVVGDNDVGLEIVGAGGPPYGADVSGNDFVGNAVPIVADLVARVDGNYWGADACPAYTPPDPVGLGADCTPYNVSVADGVPAGAETCGDATRPRVLDRICAFTAPADVTASGAMASFEVAVGFSGEYTATAFGLAPEVITAGVLLPTAEEGNTRPDELSLHPIQVPAGTRYLRIALDGEEPDREHNIGLLLFDGTCAVIDWDCPILADSNNGNETAHIDLPDAAAGPYVIAIGPWYIDGEKADFALSTWMVSDADDDLVVRAAREVVAGTTVDVEITWPEELAAGTYVGVIDHANEVVPLGSTLLEVVLP